VQAASAQMYGQGGAQPGADAGAQANQQTSSQQAQGNSTDEMVQDAILRK